ncbi:hypothetical protein COLO4_30480 [Corchorus olitorius]|uniref:PGG domain-containing protein n=1 Tax=Corchorus olitorius TaxID=93759 RepID=A0A1R3H8A7_9ROSI|nr:hypothetical protein COLO4_30480 [Corchorus olitorius]
MTKQMDPKLLEAIARNYKHTFTSLARRKKGILEQRDPSSNTTLHLAARFGHVELVAEIVRLCPDLLLSENDRQENPLHEACRQGNHEVVALLFETNPVAATKLNNENQSPFLLACRNGHLMVQTDADVINQLLQARPHFARKSNKKGLSPLHYASSRGHLETTKLLLSHDADLALQYDSDGHTPLHLAVINGYMTMLEAFLSSAPTAFGYLTRDGETVFHLAIRFEKYNAFVFLARFFNFTNLLRQPDGFGNTILHLSVLRENYQTVKYIIDTTIVDINHQNHKGYTALDILEHARIDAENEQLKALLQRAGAKYSTELLPLMPEIKQIHPPMLTHGNPGDIVEEKELTVFHPSLDSRRVEPKDSILSIEPSVDLASSSTSQNSRGDFLRNQIASYLPHSWKERMVLPTPWHQKRHLSRSCGHLPDLISTTEEVQRNDLHEHQNGEKSIVQEKCESPKQDKLRNLWQLKCASERRRKELSKLHRIRRHKQYEMHREAALNARNTIVLVAILIATVTFSAGINPPGSVYQEGHLKGKSLAGKTKAFKIFMISNYIALFTSLGIVVALVSIIPFKRKQLMRLILITHKLMWVSLSFTATAFISGTWVVVPQGRNGGWMVEVLLAISAGSLGILFIYLGVAMSRHQLRKLRYRDKNKERVADIVAIQGKSRSQSSIFDSRRSENQLDQMSQSTNSDVDSSTSLGYHAY